MAFDLFKLEKLRISAFESAARQGKAVAQVEALWNPASYSQTYSIAWQKKQGLNSSGAELSYTWSVPGELALDLVLDDTGVDQMGLLAIGRKSVSEQVDALLDATFRYKGAIHEPGYLLLSWGKLEFACRLSTMTVNYTRFHRDGTPLRAEIKAVFLSDQESAARAREEGRQSPDLPHSRLVKSGDTLPSLTKEVYGSTAPYLLVARHNDLDDTRRLAPGTRLLFPPLATLTRAAPRRWPCPR